LSGVYGNKFILRTKTKPLCHFVTSPLSGETLGAISMPPLTGEGNRRSGGGVASIKHFFQSIDRNVRIYNYKDYMR